MRIDDENKVVWCNEPEMDWYTSFNLSVGDSGFLKLRRINTLSTEKEVLLPNYMTVIDRVEIIRAISNNYEFKLEQPKKYYWRKKDEYLAWFEDSSPHLILHIKENRLLMWKHRVFDANLFKIKFTEAEARDLLKDDFDKFEKVECE